MIIYFAGLLGFGGGDDGLRRIERIGGPPNGAPEKWAVDPFLQQRIFRGECLPREEVAAFRQQMDFRGIRKDLDYRLVKCTRDE